MIRFSAFLIALFSVMHPIIRAADGGTGGTREPLIIATIGGGRASSPPMTGAEIAAFTAPVSAPGRQAMGAAPVPPLPEPKASSYYPEGKYVQCFCKKCDSSFLLYVCYCGRILYWLPFASACSYVVTGMIIIGAPIYCCVSCCFYACCPENLPAERSGWDCHECTVEVCCCPYLHQENVVCPRDLCCLWIDEKGPDSRGDEWICGCCREKCCYEGPKGGCICAKK